MKVKGTWLSDYVTLIRSYLKTNPEKKVLFDKFLTKEDWDILSEWILPSKLYPYDFFQHVGTAVYVIIAKEKKETSQLFGSMFFRKLIEIYKNLLVTNNPVSSLEKFTAFHQAYFKEVESRTFLIESTNNSALIRLKLIESDKQIKGAEGLAYQLAGTFQEIVKQAGCDNVTITTTKELDGNYLYTINWK